MSSLTERTVMVTGGGGGIGSATSLVLARAGATWSSPTSTRWRAGRPRT